MLYVIMKILLHVEDEQAKLSKLLTEIQWQYQLSASRLSGENICCERPSKRA